MLLVFGSKINEKEKLRSYGVANVEGHLTKVKRGDTTL